MAIAPMLVFEVRPEAHDFPAQFAGLTVLADVFEQVADFARAPERLDEVVLLLQFVYPFQQLF